jgi:hypothetical protein
LVLNSFKNLDYIRISGVSGSRMLQNPCLPSVENLSFLNVLKTVKQYGVRGKGKEE